MSLPRYAALLSPYFPGDKYVHCIKDEGKHHGNLCLEDSALNLRAKFGFERSKTDNSCFHIRCCYNNKYWTRDSAEHGARIVAAAHDPKDNGWNSTLFKVEFVRNSRYYVFMRHMGNQDLVRVVQRGGDPKLDCLVGVRDDRPHAEDKPGAEFLFGVVDWESLVVLPRYVAFKGDNGCYLQARMIERHEYHQFSSQDSGSFSSHYEIFPNHDGTVRIKSKFFGKFWRRSPNWIWADSSDTSSKNRDTLFWPVKIGPKKIALRNLGNNNFCARLTTEGKTSCLNASTPTVCKEATLEVQELILSRKIYNVKFRLADARIYSEELITMASLTATNLSSVQTTDSLKFSYTKTTTHMWSSSVSLKLGVETTIQAGAPLLADGKIAVKAEVEGRHEWGTTTQISEQVEEVHKVTVPPMKKVIAELIATRGKCDVPFSYTQRETLLDGTVVTSEMDDGVFYGGNMYNIHVKTREEPIK